MRLRGGPGHRAACARAGGGLLVALFVLLGASEPLFAQTRDELRAAIRRLRQTEGSLEPLPNTGITRDAGQVAIVEHDGSNYDARIDGVLNYEARTRVGVRFYETHADAYDFLVVFTNFPFQTEDATAFHLFGRNDVEGIGKPVGAAGDLVFGSPARLKGWIDMADVSQYREKPFSLTPGDLGFLQTLDVLAHEMGHQWLAEATYRDGDAERRDLLGADGKHWSYLLDSDASLFYGADWRDNGDGTFTAEHVKERYFALDLYLMGLLPKEKVPPLRLLRNPTIDATRINREGEVVTATGTTEVHIDQLIAQVGPRRPDWLHSQKEFRLGFVFLTKPGTEPSEEDLAAVERVRRAFGAHFFALTHGVAWADTTLVETPSPPLAAAPDLPKALAWLTAQQGLDGSWSDAAETRLRDTAAAVWALATAGAAGPAWSRGIAWLQHAQPESLDFRARLASGLAPRTPTAAERAARVASLLSAQNADGGFGAGMDFASDALDTALALRALKALDHPEDGRVRLAVSALAGLANADGGWPAVCGGETSTVATAEVLLALLDWSEAPGSVALRGTGLAALLARKNSDGGFGSSPSTPHATALVLDVLLRSGAPADMVGPATAWLEANQLANGSWAGSPYQTALVVAALRQSIGPNLVVPAAALALSPNPAQEGEVVRVTARVRNAGRETAPATVSRLYDGDPASSLARGEAAVPALAPGAEAEVAFDYPTQDHPGTRTLSVVADAAASVRESREDDNTAGLALTVAGKLADLVVGPMDIVVRPVAPEVGEGVTITVTVHNAGERTSTPAALLVSVTDPLNATSFFPLASLPALAPGESAPAAVPWTPSRAGQHFVLATADPRYDVPESDETNNEAQHPAPVVDQAPEGAQLAVVSPVLAPDTLTELPQEIDVRATLENRGRSRVESRVAAFDTGADDWEWTRLGDVTVEIEPRSATPISLRVSVASPGARQVVLVADPDDEIPEPDESDNYASATLADARTLDLELETGSISLSSPEVESGETVSVEFIVRNRGTVDVPLVPVQLANAASGGELARADVDVPAGQARAVSLSWRTGVPGNVPLSVRVDPFDLLRETKEDNNAASVSLRVHPSGLPNLSVSGGEVTFVPDPPVEGEAAVVSALVRNVGAVPAGPFAVRFYVGDPDAQGILIGEASVPGLGPEAGMTVPVTWSAVNARGTLGAFVLVDALGQVDESDESDNRAFRPFQATGLPDLVLTAADVVLDPGYPRAGEEVTIRTTVRNLGGQPSAPASLRVAEGRATPDTVVGVLAVPELAPGAFASLSLPWTPSSPPGERRLRLEVDPDGLVVEQDEGNNEARRTVVVQDADFYLTEPYFSPNGDGVKDETTLAWRSTGHVGVVVSNGRGQVVRTLVADGPATGSATWDGRDERGVVTWDGSYTVTLTGEGFRVLGRALVDLDTDRSPIQHASGPAETAVRNLTCSLPPSVSGPAWMPGEDDVLFVVHGPDPRLVRVGLDGSSSDVVRDASYAQAYFPSAAAVSPDGREALLWLDGQLVAVDLATGDRRTVSDLGGQASWSPDGRFVLVGGTVLQRDGTVVAEICGGGACGSEWAWSPTSDRLVGFLSPWAPSATGRDPGQLTIVARDGALLDSIPLPWDEDRDYEYIYGRGAAWRADGKIVARVDFVIHDDGESVPAAYVVDPETRAVKRVPVDGSWSPDGSRVLDDNGTLWLEDGTSLGSLVHGGVAVSPRSSAASYWKSNGDTRPGSVCGGKSQDLFAVSMLANLTAQLDLARLPGNTGLLVKGTATDRNLDRFEIDYASRDDPEAWHPIGTASDAPVVDDLLTAWVPPGPGTYLVRLRVSDRAGNARVLTRLVSAERVPAIANFTQSEYFVSPTVDTVKDEVVFRYLVLEPTRLEVRIVGPEPASATAPAAREVRHLAFEYPEMGAQSFAWNGTDDAAEVVPDGRYTVYLNGLPFRVEVDDTPPEIDLRYLNPRVEAEPYLAEQSVHCQRIGIPPTEGNVELATVVGDQSWHVVDRHLRSWVVRSPGGETARGTDLVYVPATDANGLPILDAGVPRIRREGGRPVSRTDGFRHFQSLAGQPSYTLAAEDSAGNRSEIVALPPAEGLWMLGTVFEEAGYGCKAFPVSPDFEGVSEDSVAGLRPENGSFLAGASLYTPLEGENVRLSFQPLKGGPWAEVPARDRVQEGLWSLPIASFESMGLDPTAAYRGRFLGHGRGGEIRSESFTFRPCEEWIQARSGERADHPGVVITLGAKLHVPLTRARAHVWQRSVDSTVERDLGFFDMRPERSPDGTQVFVAFLPPNDCTSPYRYVVDAEDAAGRRYGDPEFVKACQRLSGTQPSACQFAVKVVQQFPGCGGSPDDLHLRAYLLADEPVFLEVESGPEGAVLAAPPVAIPIATMTPLGLPYRDFVLDVKAWPEGAVPARARLRRQLQADVVAADEKPAFIDRTAPKGTVLLPPEGGVVCAAAGSAVMDVVALGEDAAPELGVEALAQAPDGSWQKLPRVCANEDVACRGKPSVAPSGRPVTLSWDVGAFPSGDHDLQLRLCDRSGNASVTPRHFSLTREPPTVWIQGVSRPVLSPNADGRADDTTVVARLAQAVTLSAEVRSGDATGPLVRTLFADQSYAATDVAAAWDGRTDGGATAPDGPYSVVFRAVDACGNARETSARVEVDTVPPEVEIGEPAAGQRVSASVDVLGRATDPHIATWTLDLSCGASGDWTPLATKTHPVAPGSFLARWDTSRAPPGECRLRLVAEDQAANRSPEAFATATVERGELLKALSATPEVFSPNGDGRRETATLGYSLLRAGRVRMEVRDSGGHVLRTFETGDEREAGDWGHPWDGLDDTGKPAAEGLHTLWVRAEDPDVATVYEEKTIRVDLDRTAPKVVIVRPGPDGFASPASAVRGSVTDRNLVLFTVSVAPAGSPLVELARGSQEVSSERDIAPLSSLAEGPHALRLVALDRAENETRLDRPFQVDATPPRAAIQAPANGAFLRRGEPPIPVTGLATDDHLESWTLRFGAGAEPAAFAPIAQGATGGDVIALGPWGVSFVPDGVHTLSLVVTDRAGLSTEARVAVTLDSVPPSVAISSPVAGGYVTKPGPIAGAASDVNLASWELESAPGDAAAAYQWSPLHSGAASITGEALADWSPLPPDGVYTLRLTARDRVDLSASTKTTVTVDTTPPAMPTGLAAKVTKAREGYGLVVLTWNPNTEPDLAGYRVEPPRETWSTGVLGRPTWDDGERVEGRYTYRVLAEDKAGNQSPAATLEVLVDLTPPLVSLSSPGVDASVAGAVSVRGTAWSADDFAEYRLYVGSGEAPASWTLLRQSAVPVAAGTLGEWLALADGPYVLALEAEDTNGNEARVTRRVLVDTLPPEPLVLIAVAKQSPPADWLVPSWQPGPSDDVIGTLVYRNGRLANATSVVLGDRKGFLVPGTSYRDESLPDGEHCYRVVAMDAAGNESVPSNEICQSLENRTPTAVIVHPSDGTRFSQPVRVVAETPDLDVATVRFERRVSGSVDWVGFGDVRSAPPWETTLDPDPAGGEELAAGAHELRAVATDRAGSTDPAPAAIAVVYGDTTPPLAPTGLVARVDGTDVTLTWTPVETPDLASYSLYRDGERIAEGLTESHRVDPGLALDTYEYVVTAVDGDGNEGTPSAPAEAIVYRVSLEWPAWPAVSSSVGSVKGLGSRVQTTVTILRDDAGIAQGEGSGGAFTVDDVPLVPDGNVLRARGEDAAGNRSIVSDEIVLISNAAPGPVTGLEAQVEVRTVSLQWAPVADADLAGYVVHRDGDLLTRTVPQKEAASITATSGYGQTAAWAFDGNPATAWRPYSPGTGTWTVTFPAPVLIEQVTLRFAPPEGTNPGTSADYTIFVRWQDRVLPIVRVRDNTQVAVEHRLPAPFLTSAVSVALESPGSLAEVTIERLDVVPAGTRAFQQQGVPDGRHTYEVRAIDVYGALGGAGAVPAAVGDVDPPSRPLGLVAAPIEKDVHLTWNPNPEPDIASYVVLRDGERIGTTSNPAWVDPGLENGTYRYTVTAVDAAGLESAESDPADATIDTQPGPLAAPVILEPTDAANPTTLAASVTDVAGRADPGSSVALEVDGEPRGTALAGPGFRPAERVVLPVGYDIAFSPDGTQAAWNAQAGAISLQDLRTGAIRLVPHGGEGWAGRPVFSPDGSRLVLARAQPVAPYLQEVAVLRLDDGGSVRALTTGDPIDYAWESGGTLLAVSFYEAQGSSLSVIDVATGQRTERDRSSGIDRYLRWSPDGRRLAFIRTWWDSAAELRVLHFPTDLTRVLDHEPWPDALPSWSPDGRRLAWTTAGKPPLRVRVQEVDGDQPSDITDAGSSVLDARFSPDGRWLSYVRLTALDEWTALRSIHAIHQKLGLRVTVSDPQSASGVPDGHEWFGGTLAVRAYDRMDFYASEAGRFVLRDVPLTPGGNRLVARAGDPATGRTSPDSETVLVTVPDGAFPDLAIVSGGLVSVPPVPLAASAARLRVRVENRGGTDAGETEVRVRVVDPAGDAVLDTRATLAAVASGGESSILLSWTPAAAGTYTVLAEVDPDGLVAESSEENNEARREVIVVAEEGLGAEIGSDRASYPALGTARVTVRVANAGTPFAGVARTTVEDAAGTEVALLEERAVSLEWGRSVSYGLDWSTGTTPAGPYAFRVRVRATGETEPSATAERPFAIEPGLSLLARVLPQPLVVTEGSPASLVLGVENGSTNVALEGATARLRLWLEGTSGPATLETVRALPSLPAGGSWGATDVWAIAQPAGRYTALFEVAKGDVVLASGSAILAVAPAAPLVKGTVTVEPGDVLVGAAAEAVLGLQNQGAAAVPGYPLAVELVAGPEATVHLSVPAVVDLAAGESRSLTVPLATAGVAPGRYVVRLRGGASPVTLDRSRLVVHGVIAPPSPHAPGEGARVGTAHPPLVVNNASSPEGAVLTYEYALFGDEALTQDLPGATGVAETPLRTAWTVAAGLGEDTTYWWRARATDSFSTSAWSAVASFTVDAVNRPPTSPVPDMPLPGARVASRQPALVVRNAQDPERQALTYEFRLASDEGMTQVVAAEGGVTEGLGLTAWTVTKVLDEDAVYYWSARAKTAGESPEDSSPWSVPVSFQVDSGNESPTAPTPLRPIGGAEVDTHAPTLVVANATDPEADPLTYRFEIDVQPDLGSTERQVSEELGEGPGETHWTPPSELRENTAYYWRAQASDGRTSTPSALARFFVDAANEAPSAPVPLDPVDGRTVGTATPTLRLRNAADPEGDRLTYEIEVRDASDAVVAQASGVPSGVEETTWTVTPPLGDGQDFTWWARAGDGELSGPWSARAAFRVAAVAEPPTAPVPLLPVDGALVEERRPPLVVENATSLAGLPLSYTFELEAVAGDGSTTPVDRAEGIPETPQTTAWTPSVDLADGPYHWRARASDPQQDGPWSTTSRFDVLVDPPPAPPTGLRAVAGDARVRLDWNASPEPDVTGYRVYRSTTTGGPYAFVAAATANGHDDLGLANGVTYSYVVTSTDARSESGFSSEATARPEVPQALEAEVRYDPAVIRGECLRGGDPCPDWLLATLELPVGQEPTSIDVTSLRVFGSVPVDAGYANVVDSDNDGLTELQVRVAFDDVAVRLSVGFNLVAIVGRAGPSEVQGTGTIEVLPLSTDLWVTPRTLQRHSNGQDVQASVTFAEGVSASEALIASIRLNGVVPVDRVVKTKGRELVVKFDRAAAIGVLPLGDEVEVRVTGMLQGLPFVGIDHIRVIE